MGGRYGPKFPIRYTRDTSTEVSAMQKLTEAKGGGKVVLCRRVWPLTPGQEREEIRVEDGISSWSTA